MRYSQIGCCTGGHATSYKSNHVKSNERYKGVGEETDEGQKRRVTRYKTEKYQIKKTELGIQNDNKGMKAETFKTTKKQKEKVSNTIT